MNELELSALEWAWAREPVDGGFAVWMVRQSLERNGIALERLSPGAIGSVREHGDSRASDGRGNGSLERMASSPSSDAPAAHRPI